MKQNILKEIIIFCMGWFLMGLFFAFVGYVFGGLETPFTKCLNHPGTWIVTATVGWIPGVYINSENN